MAPGRNTLAINTADGWNFVYAGEATPECSQVEPYGFPINMVTEFSDKNNQLVGGSGGEEIRIGEALAAFNRPASLLIKVSRSIDISLIIVYNMNTVRT